MGSMAGDLAAAAGAATWTGKGAVWLALFLGMSRSALLRANNLRGPAVTMEILETQVGDRICGGNREWNQRSLKGNHGDHSCPQQWPTLYGPLVCDSYLAL